MSKKSVKQECLTRALRNSVKQGCLTKSFASASALELSSMDQVGLIHSQIGSTKWKTTMYCSGRRASLSHMYACPYVVLWCRCNRYPTPAHPHAHIFSTCPTPSPSPSPSPYLFSSLLVLVFSFHGTVTHAPPHPIPIPISAPPHPQKLRDLMFDPILILYLIQFWSYIWSPDHRKLGEQHLDAILSKGSDRVWNIPVHTIRHVSSSTTWKNDTLHSTDWHVNLCNLPPVTWSQWFCKDELWLVSSSLLQDLRNYTVTLSALENSKQWQWALELLSDMSHRKLHPDLTLGMSCCGHAGIFNQRLCQGFVAASSGPCQPVYQWNWRNIQFQRDNSCHSLETYVCFLLFLYVMV